MPSVILLTLPVNEPESHGNEDLFLVLCATLSVLVNTVHELGTSRWKACSFSLFLKVHIQINVANFTPKIAPRIELFLSLC